MSDIEEGGDRNWKKKYVEDSQNWMWREGGGQGRIHLRKGERVIFFYGERNCNIAKIDSEIALHTHF